MKQASKKKMHFTPAGLLQPTNPVRVNLIGCGGTGSRVLDELARIHYALLSFGHPGMSVYVFDEDTVSAANVGRGFLKGEIGLNKAGLLVNNINRSMGTDWKAFDFSFGYDTLSRIGYRALASVTITCVDKVRPRLEIIDILKDIRGKAGHHAHQPLYHLDFGNSQYTGQVILSTVGEIEQPASKKYRPVATLPLLTDEYRELLAQSTQEDDSPSCSLPVALTKQDLFINPSLATLGTSLLWKLFRQGMSDVRGFFLNLATYRLQPLMVD
ncbi:PRTRC system ThiF family protein [Chitinophaga sp. YIM B06452]|uniref:PRTRC system ThiF family protein n=1 Tax=Chitinophaga sp. YIM B06452 TaxID=3082158 RepID=UPI0031FF4150